MERIWDLNKGWWYEINWILITSRYFVCFFNNFLQINKFGRDIVAIVKHVYHCKIIAFSQVLKIAFIFNFDKQRESKENFHKILLQTFIACATSFVHCLESAIIVNLCQLKCFSNEIMLKESFDGGPREVLEKVGYTDLLLTANSAQCFEEMK